MKKLLSGIFIVFFCVNAFGQKQKEKVTIPVLPVDSISGLYTYTEVVQQDKLSKTDLFNKALAWANTYYKNPGDVIREKNSDQGKIIIKARFKINNEATDKKSTETAAGDVMYTLTFLFKDGRYKYEITKINWQQLSYYPIERWKDTEAQSFNPVYASYLTQTDENIKKIVSDFKKYIAATPSAKQNDW